MKTKTVRHIFLLFLFLLVSTGRASAQAGEIFQLVNQFRSSAGLAPFQWNDLLAVAAQNHANWMAATLTYSHTEDNGSTPQTRANAAGYVGYVVENIVGGTNLTPQQGLVWWQNSPPHLNTLVSTRHSQAGTGFAVGGGQNFYVLVVGQPSNAPSSTSPPTTIQPDAPSFVPLIAISPPDENGSIIHTVGQGHTLWAIAARYGVTVSEILYLNGLPEDALLVPGQQIFIRLGEGIPLPPTPTPRLTYTVRSGETLWTIAAMNHISVETLMWLNHIDEETILQPGQEIILNLAPGQAPPPTPTPQLAHIVQSGDTLWSVALQYGLTLEQLVALNGLSAEAVLNIGQELYIRPPDTPTPEPTLPPSPATETPQAVLAAAITVLPPTLVATNTPLPTEVMLEPSPTPQTLTNSLPPTTAPAWMVWVAVGLVVVAGGIILVGRLN